ncbi:MAG: RNA chaperone Hfq [Candidatus Sumerlaeaceae bacterium]|nr:RNA chaperone Hfq [Candidatus Sumerlaeaceae bacterium]
MAKAAGNLQDSVLNQLRKDNAEVEFFFLSGKSLKGTVRGFDNFTIIVRDAEGHHHLIYKHAVAHIASAKPFGLRQPSPARQKAGDEAVIRTEGQASEGGKEALAKKEKGAEPFNRIDLSHLKISE